MNRLSLLLLPLLLSACTNNYVAQRVPEAEATAEERCVIDCEFSHSGQIRACVRQPVTEGRGVAFKRCISEAYEALGVCYRACD